MKTPRKIAAHNHESIYGMTKKEVKEEAMRLLDFLDGHSLKHRHSGGDICKEYAAAIRKNIDAIENDRLAYAKLRQVMFFARNVENNFKDA